MIGLAQGKEHREYQYNNNIRSINLTHACTDKVHNYINS